MSALRALFQGQWWIRFVFDAGITLLAPEEALFVVAQKRFDLASFAEENLV